MQYALSLSRRVVLAVLVALAALTAHSEAIAAQLTLSWADGSANETGFAVERSLGATQAFAEIGDVGPDVTAYSDDTVASGTAYCYRVRAFNAVGNSSYTNMACATVATTYGLAVLKVGAGSGTVTSAPAGIACGASCSGSYPGGAVVTLTATPAAGSILTSWSGGGCSGTGTCAVTLNAGTVVTATFAPAPVPPVTLTASVAGSGQGTIGTSAGPTCGASCTWSYPKGTAVTLTATPAAGSIFTGWSGACSGAGACAVTLNAATSVTATFAPAPVPPSVTLSVSIAGRQTRGTVISSPAGIHCPATCLAQFPKGTRVTLTAVPATGNAFRGWSGGGCRGTRPCTVTLSAKTAVVAAFARK